MDPTTGDTALHIACRMGDDAAAELLLRAAPSLCAMANRTGETPLQTAHLRQRYVRAHARRRGGGSGGGGGASSSGSLLDGQRDAAENGNAVLKRCERLVHLLSRTVHHMTGGRNLYKREVSSVEVVAQVLMFLTPTERRRAARVSHSWTWASMEASRLVRLETESHIVARQLARRRKLRRRRRRRRRKSQEDGGGGGGGSAASASDVSDSTLTNESDDNDARHTDQHTSSGSDDDSYDDDDEPLQVTQGDVHKVEWCRPSDSSGARKLFSYLGSVAAATRSADAAAAAATAAVSSAVKKVRQPTNHA